jgi:hypothetical protein
VLQVIKIVGEAEQEGLAALRQQTAARSAAREFAFGDREDSLDQGTAGVFLPREMVSHLGANAVNAPSFLTPLGGDDTQGMQLPADKGVIALGIELGIGQHAADGSVGMGLRHQSGQVGAIVPRGLTGRLRQNELPFQVHHGPPLQAMPPRQRGAASEAGQRHALNHFVQGVSDGGFLQPPQETIQSRVVGNRAKPQSTAQFRVFGQPYLGFPIGPVFVAHEAQDSQQLRLRELVFAERCAIPPQLYIASTRSPTRSCKCRFAARVPKSRP